MSQEFYARNLKLSGDDQKKEFDKLFLQYWEGTLKQFEILVLKENLDSKIDLVKTKEYRSVKKDMELRIEWGKVDVERNDAKEKSVEKSVSGYKINSHRELEPKKVVSNETHDNRIHGLPEILAQEAIAPGLKHLHNLYSEQVNALPPEIRRWKVVNGNPRGKSHGSPQKDAGMMTYKVGNVYLSDIIIDELRKCNPGLDAHIKKSESGIEVTYFEFISELEKAWNYATLRQRAIIGFLAKGINLEEAGFPMKGNANITATLTPVPKGKKASIKIPVEVQKKIREMADDPKKGVKVVAAELGCSTRTLHDVMKGKAGQITLRRIYRKSPLLAHLAQSA